MKLGLNYWHAQSSGKDQKIPPIIFIMCTTLAGGMSDSIPSSKVVGVSPVSPTMGGPFFLALGYVAHYITTYLCSYVI